MQTDEVAGPSLPISDQRDVAVQCEPPPQIPVIQLPEPDYDDTSTQMSFATDDDWTQTEQVPPVFVAICAFFQLVRLARANTYAFITHFLSTFHNFGLFWSGMVVGCTAVRFFEIELFLWFAGGIPRLGRAGGVPAAAAGAADAQAEVAQEAAQGGAGRQRHPVLHPFDQRWREGRSNGRRL